MRFFSSNAVFFRGFFLSLLVLIGSGVSANPHPAPPLVKFKFLGIEQGLSQSSVMAITEDKHGFIWLGTQDGLNRYDGYEFHQFKYQENNPYSLADNFIRALLYDSQNRLWVGTMNGLSLYHEEQETFTNFVSSTTDAATLWDNQIWDIFEDHQQRIWVSTANGLQRFDEAQGTFQRLSFSLDGFQHSPQEIKEIFQDDRGYFWFGSYSSRNFVYLEPQETLYDLSKPNPTKVVINSQGINDIVRIGRQQLAVIHDAGLILVDNDTTIELNSDESTAHYKKALWEEKERILQVFTNGGIVEYHLTEDNQLQPSNHYLSDKTIYSRFKDRSGGLWLGTKQNGVAKHTVESGRFVHLSDSNDVLPDNNIMSIAEAADGAIWLAGSSSKLSRFEKDKQTISYHDIGLEGLKNIALDDSQRLYVATELGLFRFDTQADELLKSKEVLSVKDITSVSFYRDDIYFGTWDEGVFRLPATAPGEVQKIELFEEALDYQAISTLMVHDDQLFIGSAGGLLRYDLNRNLGHEVDALKGKQISSIHFNQSTGYIGTPVDTDLYSMTLSENGEVEQVKKLLDGDMFFSVLTDNENQVWVSSNNGLEVIGAHGNRRFSESDGLQSIEFNETSSLKSSDGTLYFGGVNGLNYFQPQTLELNNSISYQLKFTDFSVFNNPVTITPNDDEGKLQQSVVFAPGVTLAYSDYPFSFKFSLVNYPQPELVKYRYRIAGVDQQWIPTTESRSATYTNLSFGDYQLEVEALIAGNPIAVVKNSLAIKILRPLWLSNWALLGYFISVCAVIYVVVRFFQQQRLSQRQVVESEERLQLSLWGSGDEMWDWDIENDRMYRSNTWESLNYPDRNDDSKGNIHPKDKDRVRSALKEHMAGETEHFTSSYRVKDKNGQWLWILDRAKVVERGTNNQPLRMTGTIKDISNIKATELKLNLQANAIANISDAVYIMDLQYRMVEVNKSLLDITGYTREQLLGSNLLFEDYSDDSVHQIKTALRQRGCWQGELTSRRQDGVEYVAEISFDAIYDEDREVSSYVAVFSDITRRKKTEEELRTLSNIDPLTKLPNRSYFQFSHRNLVRRGQPHSLLVFDLDNFKKINESLGHVTGDKLLCLLAQRIDKLLSNQHSLCRLGGDEFAILLDVSDVSVISKVAMDISRALQQPFHLDQEELVISCSVGIASYPEDGQSAESLLQNADTAMYYAKDNRAGYQFYSQSMNADAVRRLHIETLMRQALKDDLFEVHYQPKIDLCSGALSGMEALVRLNHPEHGMVRPDEFIPLAENNGLIIDIGEIVLEKACRATQYWRQQGLFSGRVAVNLSSKQFDLSDLDQRIRNILQSTQLPVEHLELEITEGTVIDQPELAIETMQTLCNMGIHLALDDFGTGYSSLSYLKRFPIHTLKIDKAFVDDIDSQVRDRNMVASIISIAHNMDLKVVAEGVETEPQLAILRKLQCEDVQGYVYSRPLPEHEFEALLHSGRFNRNISTKNHSLAVN